MLDFPRWKVWSISLVILIGILFAIPSMLPADLKARYPTWLPSATINLGLDLAEFIGAPGAIRTHDTRFRKPLLYPPELRGRMQGPARATGPDATRCQ